MRYKDVTIAAYLKRNRLSVEQFAKQVGITVSTVYRHLLAEAEPKAGTIERYVRGTLGAVTAADVILEYVTTRDAKRKAR
jgi:hypothetical protein